MTRIYTGVGDEGETQLLAGRRVSKGDPLIAALGELDELNSALGWAAAQRAGGDGRLSRTQRQLLSIGAMLAAPGPIASSQPLEGWIAELEREMDIWQAELPELRNFILPGGHRAGAALHAARAVCRRAERAYFRLPDRPSPAIGVYLNRLGDWLFLAARQANREAGAEEETWSGRVE